MKTLTQRNFYELSLLSYFNCYKGNETVEDLIVSILLDQTMIEEYKDNVMMQMNLESLRHIYPGEYRDVKIVEVFDDNKDSGVYLYRLSWKEYEIIAVRGSEELDEKHGRTGWQDWKDNFAMYLPGPTLQQLVATHYLHRLDPDRKRCICGHSKGGNLAITMTMCASKRLFDSIEKVVSINAPGITDSMMADYDIRIKEEQFRQKITLIENEHDCVSAFFHHVKEPVIVKSNTGGTTLRQLYENHQLHTILIEQDGFVVTDRKSTMPRLIHHFINDYFVKMSPQRLQGFVDRMNEYFDSGLSKQELYRVLIYQVSKYTSLFDELSYDEVANVTFQDLIERRKSKYMMERIRQIVPDEKMMIVLRKWKDDAPFSHFDVKALTNAIVENYETTINSRAIVLKTVISENNAKIMEALRHMQKNNQK